MARKAGEGSGSTARSAAEAVALERLRCAGLRTTRPRVLVYTVLREAGGHRSVDEVSALLEKRGQAIPRMSIYNVMADLTAASLVMSADTGPGRALYEASDVWHHHFVCRSCGRIEDVPCMKGRKPCLQPPRGLAGSIVDEAQVIFRGQCAACATAAAGKNKKSS